MAKLPTCAWCGKVTRETFMASPDPRMTPKPLPKFVPKCPPTSSRDYYGGPVHFYYFHPVCWHRLLDKADERHLAEEGIRRIVCRD